jgi:2-keto-4-pentenoate hydratase/2-oxohepta-3-ene-1,7-dioic acid hydratase in catechol pathway
MPEYPVFFTKSPLSISAPDADVEVDQAVTQKVDWEGELAIVIGKRGRDLPDSDVAYQYVFGYTAANDLSARDLQQRMQGSQQQWFKGKALDGFCPLGPWIVTRDEIPDPHSLEIMTRVNGVTKQHSNTSDFFFRVPKILQDISAGMTLEPGDVILTGTPAGVGYARTPKEFLQPGDIVEVEIGGIGVLRNRIVARGIQQQLQSAGSSSATRAAAASR